MRFLYNIFVYIVIFILKIIAVFNTKISLFVKGRTFVFREVKKKINKKEFVIWIHAASLGEFEQGRPIIEELKNKYPKHQIVLTFFSPSGYEVRKDYELADLVCYLPMDTIANAKKMISLLNPSLVLFIKYEFWPNYLNELHKKKIPTFLVSGIFRANQSFFKPQGFWLRKHLKTISHFFVQDKSSKNLLNSIDVKNVTIAGDTRFDRVQRLLDMNDKLSFVEEFKGVNYVVVAGSTWPEDEEQLVDYINNKSSDDEKFIIAPHNIHKEGVTILKSSIHKKVVLFSEMQGKKMSEYDVFIVDTIGILSKIYNYASVAYVGGGYTKSGVHNTLEAATYGLPIVIGPNFKKFKEVQDLVRLTGCVSVRNSENLSALLKKLYNDKALRVKKSKITQNYVRQNLGATEKIMKHIDKVLV